VWRIGAQSGAPVNVKVVAATDEDLENAVEEGWFRKPFYYRFGAKIHIPPLRERREDIPLLVYFFLDMYARAFGSRARMLSHRALRLFLDYSWPGNIRQLEHVIRTAVAKDQEIIFSWDLPDELAPKAAQCIEVRAVAAAERVQTQSGGKSTLPKSIGEVEKESIKEALEATLGNVTRAARILGYKSRQTMLNKMDRYGIPRNYADPHLPGSKV
jgi:transcriptional regulator with PAS, ATPase and Fis domain